LKGEIALQASQLWRPALWTGPSAIHCSISAAHLIALVAATYNPAMTGTAATSSPQMGAVPLGGVIVLARHVHPNDGRLMKTRAALAAAGFEAVLMAPGGDEPQAAGVRVIDWSGAVATLGAISARFGFAPLQRPLNYRAQTAAVTQAMVALAPRAIIATDVESLPAAIAARARTGAALVFDAHEFHEDENPDDPARSAWVRRKEVAATPHLDGFITVNASIAALFAKRRPGFPPATVVHNATDALIGLEDDGRLRAAAGIDPDARILLYQGKFSAARGLEEMIIAANGFDRRWRLVMMGWGPLEAQFQAAADPTRVRFLAPAAHAELARWTCGAALGVLLNGDRGANQELCSPNRLWEYPAAHVPILASDLPELRRVVDHYGIGVLVGRRAGPEQLRAAVQGVDDHRLAQMRAACAAFTRTESWQAQAARLVAAVKAAIVKRAAQA
jgi:glycosyltransferase involved in cell wall biosynthesis